MTVPPSTPGKNEHETISARFASQRTTGGHVRYDEFWRCPVHGVIRSNRNALEYLPMIQTPAGRSTASTDTPNVTGRERRCHSEH